MVKCIRDVFGMVCTNRFEFERDLCVSRWYTFETHCQCAMHQYTHCYMFTVQLTDNKQTILNVYRKQNQKKRDETEKSGICIYHERWARWQQKNEDESNTRKISGRRNQQQQQQQQLQQQRLHSNSSSNMAYGSGTKTEEIKCVIKTLSRAYTYIQIQRIYRNITKRSYAMSVHVYKQYVPLSLTHARDSHIQYTADRKI